MGIFHALHGNAAPNAYKADGQCQTEPAIEPGQIWLVECENTSLSAFHAGLLTRANVVLYDRALLGVVAEKLPIGAYAEPLPAIGSAASGAAGPAIAPRALQFAADGWSVLQLVERRAGWHQRLSVATQEMVRRDGGRSPLLAIGTVVASRYRRWHGTSEDLAIAAAELGGDELLSLTFASPSLRPPAQGQVFTANGLAG
jgi:hypothetical protein